jgi:hypothetical protein
MTKNINRVYQFLIKLNHISPTIWRRIQVPENYNFWDLHIAIQDSMGWVDYHLHVFRIRSKNKKISKEVGIPFEDFEKKMLPGWEIPIRKLFNAVGVSADYEYDFGDGWEHTVTLEGILLEEDGAKYPRCIAGERACPPEDCGGVPGYEHLLNVLSNPDSQEYQDMTDWLKNHVKKYHTYKPDQFNPRKVKFDDPEKRLEIALNEPEF